MATGLLCRLQFIQDLGKRMTARPVLGAGGHAHSAEGVQTHSDHCWPSDKGCSGAAGDGVGASLPGQSERPLREEQVFARVERGGQSECALEGNLEERQ